MASKRIYGLVRQKPDPRDELLLLASRVTSQSPPAFDLSATGKSFAGVPLLNQANANACGPNTAAECLDDDQLAEKQTLSPPSRLFIYWFTRYLMDTVHQDSGVDNRTMLKALNKFGYCPESMWAYHDDLAHIMAKPNLSCITSALQKRILAYQSVRVEAAQIKAVISNQLRPIVFGTDVFAGIESDQASETGVIPDPKPGETPIGAHDMSLLGYDDVKKRFKLRQHWVRDDGTPWGDNGYAYLSYKYGLNTSWVSDLWVIQATP
jgi:C1A family cysteine protease